MRVSGGEFLARNNDGSKAVLIYKYNLTILYLHEQHPKMLISPYLCLTRSLKMFAVEYLKKMFFDLHLFYNGWGWAILS